MWLWPLLRAAGIGDTEGEGGLGEVSRTLIHLITCQLPETETSVLAKPTLLAETDACGFWNNTRQSLTAAAVLGLCPHVSQCCPWVGLCSSCCLINSGIFCAFLFLHFFTIPHPFRHFSTIYFSWLLQPNDIFLFHLHLLTQLDTGLCCPAWAGWAGLFPRRKGEHSLDEALGNKHTLKPAFLLQHGGSSR